VTNYSVGHERTTFRYNLQLRWSPTDAALAYYLSKSSRNDLLRAKYQRIRVAQKLLGTIESTFFRLLTLQKLLPMANKLKALRTAALKEMEHLFEDKLKSIEDYHQAKKDFLRSAGMQLIIQDDFERQRNILATAMRLSPEFSVGCGFYVEGPVSTPVFRDGIQRMEMQGIKNRPEAHEAGLNYLNSVNDVRRAFIKYFPKVTGYYKYTRDKDKFLFHKDWNEVGVRTYFDFTEWVTNWDESTAARSNAAKAEAEVSAVALGIASQVRNAALKYYRALRQLANAEASTKISRRVFETAKVRARRDDISRLQLLEVEASTLQEEIDRTRALGEANATLAELRAEMGVNYKEPPQGN
jgi:outer membrane protein TolC